MASSVRGTIPKNNHIRIRSMLLVRGILVVFGTIYIILMATTTQSQYKGENAFTGNRLQQVRDTRPTSHHRTNQKSHLHRVVGSAVEEENLGGFRQQQRQPRGIESREKQVVASTRWSNNGTQMIHPKYVSAWSEEYPAANQTPLGHPEWILPKTDLVRADATTTLALVVHQPNLTGPASLATDTLASFFNASTWNDTTLDDETSLLAHFPLPDWMRRYLRWHRQKRLHMQIHGSRLFKQERWLVVQCLGEHDSNCGGTADRLKPLPWALRVAHNTKRILLIHWTKPGHLEDFLLPPQGGIDWRAPAWLAQMVRNTR
jgi:hypothetical protein